ncbi:hypothetical protein Ddye_018456 [Dipteronia dyeriana]|uniref:DUF4283 domain-containing protein n=1 Tax=Dipteronia dyeriana TaxID=168575 RepID=A0AAD9UB96_9ROSI|nr:hypothetical protein Ddye_018456 [Dipteronia dyeriana]
MKIARVQKLGMCLAGRILSLDLINGDAFRSVISKIWRVRGEIEIEAIASNTYAFHFQFHEDQRKMLAGGPWSFDDSLIVLKEPSGKEANISMKFNSVEFWVQISNIPILCMTKEIGRFLSSIIGDVRDVDTCPFRDCLGHTVRECLEADKDGSPLDQNLSYGVWMKAFSPGKTPIQRRWGGSPDSRRGLGNNRSSNLVPRFSRTHSKGKDIDMGDVAGFIVGSLVTNSELISSSETDLQNGKICIENEISRNLVNVFVEQRKFVIGEVGSVRKIRVILSDEGIGPLARTKCGQQLENTSGPKIERWKRATRMGQVLGPSSPLSDTVCGKRTGSPVDAGFFEGSTRPKSDSTETFSDEALSAGWHSPARRSQ